MENTIFAGFNRHPVIQNNPLFYGVFSLVINEFHRGPYEQLDQGDQFLLEGSVHVPVLMRKPYGQLCFSRVVRTNSRCHSFAVLSSAVCV